MSPYTHIIIGATNCTEDQASQIECIMRDFVVGHPLDSLSKKKLIASACEAYELFQAERELFEEHFEKIKKLTRTEFRI